LHPSLNSVFGGVMIEKFPDEMTVKNDGQQQGNSDDKRWQRKGDNVMTIDMGGTKTYTYNGGDTTTGCLNFGFQFNPQKRGSKLKRQRWQV